MRFVASLSVSCPTSIVTLFLFTCAYLYICAVQVPVESLVKLIGIMDKHVIDTAELQMNVLPVSLLCMYTHIV